MKLRNKKTGDICEVLTDSIAVKVLIDSHDMTGYYTSLAELNEEWEDYEEPKEYWIIDTILHEIRFLPCKNNEEDKRYEQWLEELGLKFGTKEEAEKAVEKLKAWKRLKDKGFRFLGYYHTYHTLGETKSKGEIGFEMADYKGIKQDLELLFGGEE